MIRSIYSTGNVLIRKFHMCSTDVKVRLYNSFCTSFYGLVTLTNFKCESLRKLKVAYNRIFRGLFMFKCDPLDIPKTHTIMLNLNITPFAVINRMRLHGFYIRISDSCNTLVNCIYNSMVYNNSRFLNRYIKTVYFNHSFIAY